MKIPKNLEPQFDTSADPRPGRIQPETVKKKPGSLKSLGAEGQRELDLGCPAS